MLYRYNDLVLNQVVFKRFCKVRTSYQENYKCHVKFMRENFKNKIETIANGCKLTDINKKADL